MAQRNRPRVVIIGSGFGGLFAARTLRNKPVDVLLVDRNNFHTFTPLIYQVATCALGADAVAYPIRTIFHKYKNVQFLLGTVTEIDHAGQKITVESDGKCREEAYDYLIIAAGSVATYFGNTDFERYSFELNTLVDAIQMRNHVLKLFERAAWTNDFSLRDALTTIVVVGGGPTGLETSGAIHELYNYVLDKEYRQSHMRARVILIERMGNLLTPYPEKLQRDAYEQLESLGVEIILNKSVEAVHEDHVVLDDGTKIPTYTLIWSAGVKASPLAEMLEVSLQRGGRIPIERTTQVIGREKIYAVGDISYLEDKDGNPHPMLIPVAQQQGRLAARNILASINGNEQGLFEYHDRGIMATIGRRRAVAWIFNRYEFSGYFAWIAWLFLHVVTLIGFRNRLNVVINWVWNYFTYDRSVRLILEEDAQATPVSEPLP